MTAKRDLDCQREPRESGIRRPLPPEMPSRPNCFQQQAPGASDPPEDGRRASRQQGCRQIVGWKTHRLGRWVRAWRVSFEWLDDEFALLDQAQDNALPAGGRGQLQVAGEVGQLHYLGGQHGGLLGPSVTLASSRPACDGLRPRLCGNGQGLGIGTAGSEPRGGKGSYIGGVASD